jgi:hypothetical protein
MRHLANVGNYGRLYLLDDGTDTLEINSQRNGRFELNRAISDHRKTPFWKTFINDFRRRYYDWNTAEVSELTYFTVYDLNVGKGDRVIKNEYRYLRSLLKLKQRDDNVYFLGQCLVEDKFMTQSSYLSYLESVRNYYSRDKVVYIVHPRESKAMIQKIKADVGLETKQLSLPIECELAFHGPVPRVIASFFSSALESCRHLLDGAASIESFHICPQDLLRGHKEIQAFYSYLESKCGRTLCMIKLIE